MGFDCVSRTHVGLRRKLNEDSVLSCTGRHIWAVADGMGGHEAGEVASARIVSALSAIADSATVECRLQESIDVLEDVNGALVALGRSGAEQRTIGSTVVGLILTETQFACFWVGDSRAYRLREGEITQLTRDHSLVQDLVDAGMLDPELVEGHPNANVVTRAVGASDRLDVDTVTGELRAGDTFLLASDGLTRLVRDHELLTEIRARPLPDAADRLIELTLDRGAPDNVSLVIVQAI